MKQSSYQPEGNIENKSEDSLMHSAFTNDVTSKVRFSKAYYQCDSRNLIFRKMQNILSDTKSVYSEMTAVSIHDQGYSAVRK